MRVTVKLVKKLVQEYNICGTVGMDYFNGIHTITSSEGGSIPFTDLSQASKVYRILVFELFFSKPENIMSQDEFDGLCQASELGFKTFECTILG